jgi:competence protein ComEC
MRCQNKDREKIHAFRSSIDAGARPFAGGATTGPRCPAGAVTVSNRVVDRALPAGAIGLAAWLGWVAGVALQLQQVTLWPARSYGATVLLGLLAGWLVWRRVPRKWPAVTWWGLVCLAGFCLAWGQTGLRAAVYAERALAPEYEGVDIRVEGRVASLPQSTQDGLRFELAVSSAEMAGHAVRMPERLQLAWYRHARGKGAKKGAKKGADTEMPPVHAGERWQLTVRLRSPHSASNPHGFDRERWWWEQGIGAVGYVRDGPRDAPAERLDPAPVYRVDRWREVVRDRIAHRLDDPRTAGVLAALVVGDQSAIETDDWNLFRITGVAHLVSISGLHVTLFAWVAMQFVGVLWRRLSRWWPAMALRLPAQQAAGWGGLLLACVYAVFAGWGVPAQRTVLMLSIFLGLRMLGRQWPWPHVWGLALAVVLWLDPWAWLQAGFWLSFVAVAILFSALPQVRSESDRPTPPPAWRRAPAMLGKLLKEQSVVTLALAPLSLLLFGQVSVVGLLANLLAIPWVTLVLTPLALLGVAVPWLWDGAALATQALMAWLDVLAQWPWAAVYRAVPPLWMGVVAAMGAWLLVMPWPWMLRMAGLLAVWPVLAWTPARPAPGEFEVLALDVGQGSAVLVRTASHSLLFDTGPRYGANADAGRSIVVPVLRAMGESPDAVVVSHRDSDHAGGAGSVRAAWPDARWLDSYGKNPSERCMAGQGWRWDGVAFDVLHPEPEDYDERGVGRLSSNAMSCTLIIRNERQAAWLSGDLDAARETRLALQQPELRADLLIAPHHGSRTSSSPVLLNTLQPQWVLIQAGYRNRFGHPAALILNRYRVRGIQWVSSPSCGAATWRSDQPQAVTCQRQLARRYWHHAVPLDEASLESGQESND